MSQAFPFDSIRFDWTDFEACGTQSRAFLTSLVSDKGLLRSLVFSIERSPALLQLCERHRLLDKLVVCDALDRGFRLRFHLSTDEHFDRPHDHRFSFSSFILKGSYRHVWYRTPAAAGVEGHDSTKKISHQSLDRSDPAPAVTPADLDPLFVTEQRAGSCYTLHHSMLHTTVTAPHTVSLFLRGPTEKTFSTITDRDTGKVWYRYGAEDETAERRAEKTMSLEYYFRLRDALIDYGII
jgi:hypothetical protein